MQGRGWKGKEFGKIGKGEIIVSKSMKYKGNSNFARVEPRGGLIYALEFFTEVIVLFWISDNQLVSGNFAISLIPKEFIFCF